MFTETHRERVTATRNLRAREYARIARETAKATTDPKVMAMARQRAAATIGPLDRYLNLARRRQD